MPIKIRCELISWKRVYQLSQRLAFQIIESGFKPDLIIAVARGGFVPARLLCDFLQVYELAGMRVEHYLKGANKQRHARLKYPLCIDPSGLKVLVVDDVCDTGDTYHVVVNHLAEFQIASVRTAALQFKIQANYLPDYVGEQLGEWRWLIYPWAVAEDVSGFIEQINGQSQSPRSVSQRLKSDYGIQVGEEHLLDIYRMRGWLDAPN